MELKYGATTVNIKPNPRNIQEVLELKSAKTAADPTAAFNHALKNPVAGVSLESHIRLKQPRLIAIIVEDKTRKNPEYPILLDIIIKTIRSLNTSPIALVVAYGAHPQHTREENQILYGSANLDQVILVDHNPRDDRELVRIGQMSTGNVLSINRWVAAADLVISFGDITPHAFAGFSGGRKAILPGVSGYQTIQKNHAMVLHPQVGLGLLDNNPIHLEMLEAARLSGLDFVINSIRDSSGAIAAILTGDPEATFAAGVKICKELNSVWIASAVDVVYLSCGGFPKDKSLYHSQRAVIAAVRAVKKGGTIILFGQFPDGVGDLLYSEWLQKPVSDLLNLKPEAIKLGIHSAVLTARNLAHAEIILVSDLPAALATKLHFKKLTVWAEIEAYVLKKHGPDHRAYIIPNGSQILIESNVPD